MSKKLLLLLLLPALLLIGGYLALQVFLRTGTSGNGEKKQQEQTEASRGVEAYNSVAANTATADTTTKKAAMQDMKERKQTEKGSIKSEKTAGEKTSPLDLRPLFIKKMQDLVKNSSNGLYNLSVGDLQIDVLASTVSLHNVGLRPDEQAVQQLKEAGLLPQNVLSLSFEDLVIDGINLDDAINSKSMDYKLVKLVNPVVEIDRYKTGGNSGSSGDFSQQFLQQMEKLAIEKLQVEGGRITVHDKVKGGSKKIENVQVLMQDILLNDATRNDKDRFLFAKEAQLEFHDFQVQTPDGLYTFKIGDAFVNATQKSVTLKNVSYASPLSNEEFVAKQEKATEKYDLSLPELTINGVEWWPAFNGEEISAGDVQMKGGDIHIYSDRSLPPTNKMGNFPNQMLTKLPMKVEVDKLAIQDLAITYEEYSPQSEQRGTIHLDNIVMNVTNITNKKGNGQPVVVEGTALLMKAAPLKARFTFSTEEAKAGVFSANLRLDSVDATVMNPVAKPLGLMKVERGQMHSLEANLQGNENGAGGEVLVLYDKLRLSVLKKKEGEEELKKRHLLSFIANVFVIKNNNPWWLTGKTQRKEAYLERNSEAGFMNLVWKTAFLGILKTVGAPEKVAKKK